MSATDQTGRLNYTFLLPSYYPHFLFTDIEKVRTEFSVQQLRTINHLKSLSF